MGKVRNDKRCVYCLSELKGVTDFCLICGSLLRIRAIKPIEESILLLGVMFILAGVVSFGEMTGASIILFLAGYWLITRA